MEEELTVIVDPLEQKPLWTAQEPSVQFKRLNVGDYSFKTGEMSYEALFAVERKSMIDICGSLGSDRARFKAELERSKNLDFFYIVIEEGMDKCLNRKFKGHQYTQMKGSTVLKILITLLMKYNIPFFFTKSRSEARLLIIHLFQCYLKLKNNNFNFKGGDINEKNTKRI